MAPQATASTKYSMLNLDCRKFGLISPDLGMATILLYLAMVVNTPKAIKAIVESEVSKLSPGFSVYHDSRNFQPLNEDLYNAILKIAEIIQAKKPDKIARLFNPYSRMVFNRVSAQLMYNAKEFQREKDARSYLNLPDEESKSEGKE